MIDRKRIISNTIFMYIRMILIMLVSIYTSRVILDKLGVDDYGLYNAITSVVGLITFLTNTLNTSTSRFLAFEIGKKSDEKLKITFSTIFSIYILFSFFIVLFLETIGLWYLNNKFVIPEGREYAVACVYQISLLIVLVVFLGVPFVSAIIAHEDFKSYAYIGILDIFIKLGIVYLLDLSSIDNMIFYAILLLSGTILIYTIYVIYSSLKYEEINIKFYYDKNIVREVFSFTSWTVVANISNSILVQGSILLLNLYFSPAVIAAKALATQVNSAIMQFINNFRTAVNPQIIKSYAAKEYDEFKILSLESTVFVFDLFLMIGLPCIFTMKFLLSIWLVEIPPYAVEFTQLVIFAQIFAVIDSSYYVPFVAAGKLKNISYWGLITSFIYFILLYVLYSRGADVLWVQYLYLINLIIWTMFIKPYYLCKILFFDIKEITKGLVSCMKVFFLSLLTSYFIQFGYGETFYYQMLLFISVVLIVLFYSIVCMDKKLRKKLVYIVKLKIFNK